LLSRYEDFLDDWCRDGKSLRTQLVPWFLLATALAFVFPPARLFTPDSAEQLVFVAFVSSPIVIGGAFVTRAWWRAYCKSVDQDQLIGGRDD